MSQPRNRVGAATARAFSSLRIRNYRLYFIGQVISLSGTWIQSVGQAWLVLKLGGNGVDLGIVMALQFLPLLVAGPWGGVIADRTDKRRLVMVTQTAAGALALLLGILTVTGVVELWMVYALSLALGVGQMFDMPARQSFLMEMVSREQVPNAVSLNSVIVNGTRVIGPAIAAVLIATVGIGICFLINAASYVAVVTAMWMMREEELLRTEPVPRGKGQILEGLRYVWSNPRLRTPLLLMAVVGTFAYNFSVLLPLLAKFVFHGGAGAYGAMFSVMGVGAVVGGLVVAARGRATTTLLTVATFGFGVSILGAAAAPTFATELAVMFPIGVASAAFIATANALVQLEAEGVMRGRVMALWAVVFLGTTPIGSPIMGAIAEVFGARSALAIGAAATVIAGLWAVAKFRRRAVEEEPGELEAA